MDKLKGNTFVVGVAVAGLAIVGAFVYFVLGAWNAASAAEASVLDKKSKVEGLAAKSDLAGDKWVGSAEGYQKEAEAEYEKCMKYYQDADKRLERWFEKLSVKSEDQPSQGDLKTELATGINSLKTMLQSSSIEVGYPKPAGTGFGAGAASNPEGEGGFVVEDPTAGGDMKLMMKHFWIQKHVAETAKAAGIVRLEKITFPPPKIENAVSGVTQEQARMDAIGLPHNLGIFFQFRVELLCKNQDVPTFLAKLFEFNPKESYCLRIHDWTIGQTKEGLAALPDRKTVDVPETDKDSWKPPASPVQTVRLLVTGDVLDFDIKDTAWHAEAAAGDAGGTPPAGK